MASSAGGSADFVVGSSFTGSLTSSAGVALLVDSLAAEEASDDSSIICSGSDGVLGVVGAGSSVAVDGVLGADSSVAGTLGVSSAAGVASCVG